MHSQVPYGRFSSYGRGHGGRAGEYYTYEQRRPRSRSRSPERRDRDRSHDGGPYAVSGSHSYREGPYLGEGRGVSVRQQHPQHLELRHEQDGKEYARSAPAFLSVPSAPAFNESFHTTIGFNQNESQDLNSYQFPEIAHFIGSDGEVDVARLIQSRRDLLPLLKAKASGNSTQTVRILAFQNHLKYLSGRLATLCIIDPVLLTPKPPKEDSVEVQLASSGSKTDQPVPRRRSRFSDAIPPPPPPAPPSASQVTASVPGNQSSQSDTLSSRQATLPPGYILEEGEEI